MLRIVQLPIINFGKFYYILIDWGEIMITEQSVMGGVLRRFRAGDLAHHLDMVLFGELCLVARVEGVISLMDEFWSDASGQFGRIMTALQAEVVSDLPRFAHSMKGSAAALGYVGLTTVLRRIELQSALYTSQDCTDAREMLLTQWRDSHSLCMQAGFTRVNLLKIDK
jgi:hypothetical protein